MMDHHELASKLHKLRENVKIIEHYVDEHEDYDQAHVRQALLEIASQVSTIGGIVSADMPAHDHLQQGQEQ